MLELKTKYITADDFKQYFGIDLNIELPDNDNPSDKVNAFLFRVENRIAAWIDANYFIKVDRHWEVLSEEQKLQYKLALLEQAKYQIEVGDIGTDSGYDKERGVVASHSVLQSKIIAPYAYNHLVVGGFLDNRLTKRGGTFSNDKYVKVEPVVIQGQKGDPGADGKTPYIQDGYWYIDLVNTGVKAQATDGKDGATPYIQGGYWYVNGTSTGVKAQGEPGADGKDGINGLNGSGFGNRYSSLDTIPTPERYTTHMYMIKIKDDTSLNNEELTSIKWSIADSDTQTYLLSDKELFTDPIVYISHNGDGELYIYTKTEKSNHFRVDQYTRLTFSYFGNVALELVRIY